MAVQKTKNSSWLSWPWRHKIISIFAVLVLIIAGYFIYEAVALRVNRHDFEQARSAIDSVYADIVSQVGPPDNYKRANDCSRTYQEFTGYGDTTCDIDTIFNYGVNNETEANALFKKIQAAINNEHENQFKMIKPPAGAITDTLVVSSYYHAASDKYTNHGLNCVANYIFDTPRETFLAIKDISKKPLEITLGCYGPARGLYYPLAQ